MSIEEKAKAYDEALDRMKHVVIVPENEKALQALKETIFPQLRESEDERIRKRIKGLIYHNDALLDKDDLLAWLEKQKEEEGYEAIPIESTLEYKLGFKAGKESEKQKEQKLVNDKAFEEWLDDWYQGSKEAGGDVVMSEAEFKNWSRGIRNMYQQKPAEWSEEDEKMLETIIWDGSRGIELDSKQISWLKSLRPRKLDVSKLENFDPVEILNRIKKEWPMAWDKVVGKQEWSEEDEKMRCNILNALTPNLVYTTGSGTRTGTSTYKYDKEIAWLKSLRPSWKPSEEQMAGLLVAIGDEKERGSDLAKTLRSLYEQLKKL